VLLCFINPRVRKIRNEGSSCPGIFSRTLRFYYVASSPGGVVIFVFLKVVPRRVVLVVSGSYIVGCILCDGGKLCILFLIFS